MIKISNAELEVIKIVWKMKKATSLEIINQLKYCNWNDNTIRTLINRLIAKKAIGISEKVGRNYIYVALISEETYKTQKTKDFIKKIYNGSIVNLILDYIEVGKLRKNEIEEMLKLLKDRIKK